jgi:hypothetical protein
VGELTDWVAAWLTDWLVLQMAGGFLDGREGDEEGRAVKHAWALQMPRPSPAAAEASGNAGNARRPLMLPGGRRVANYPVIVPEIDAVFQKVAKKNKKAQSIETV